MSTEPEAAGAVDVAACETCDDTNCVMVDYDRGIYAPCGSCHPIQLYEAFGASHARAERLTVMLRRFVDGHHAYNVGQERCEQCQQAIAALAGDAPVDGRPHAAVPT